MAGLAVQNFVSAAVGIAVVAALARGFARHGTDSRVGNFWADLVRVTVRVLLPLAFVAALVLVAGGVIQNLSAHTEITTLAGGTQSVLGGPVASQEAIKELGHQRRRVLQRQLRPPVREPDPVDQRARGRPAAAHPVQPAPHVRPDGRRPPAGLGDPRRDVDPVGRRRRPAHLGRDGRARAGARGGRGRDGGQGGPLRRGRVRAVRRLDDDDLDRRRELDARLADRAGRRGRARRDAARRGVAGRRRQRPVRDGRADHRRGVPRRAHGRADARVPGQEDRPAGDHARRAVRADDARGRPDRLRDRHLDAGRAWPGSCRAVRTGSPRSSTPSRPPGTTTAPRSPG